jgi:hypothetical protein
MLGRRAALDGGREVGGGRALSHSSGLSQRRRRHRPDGRCGRPFLGLSLRRAHRLARRVGPLLARTPRTP